MIEIWKNIPNYENLYQVSNLGNVRSLNHIRNNGKNKKCLQKGKTLKPAIQKSDYKFVVLSKNGKTKGYRVHRLVAQTFIPNPNNLPCVNHKDENRQNNNVSNLEWCTIAYNNNYGTKKERQQKKMKEKKGRIVNQYDLNGNFIKQWKCLMDIERGLNKKRGAAIVWACCNKKTKTAYGYRWEYEN